VDFAEQVPSSEWTALEHMWEEIAEAWYRPDGDGSVVMFRVPQDRLQVSNPNQQLTIEDLLRAASIRNEEVNSWQIGDTANIEMDGANPKLGLPLRPPPSDASHFIVYVRLKPRAQSDEGSENSDNDMPLEKWQALEALWKTILGLEVSIDTLRLNMDSTRAEMEAAFKKALNVDEKVNALQADVLNWNKAKTRVHYALPKAREFIHRATWASGLHERKSLEEIVTTHIEPRIPHPQIDQVRGRMEHLQKDRQVLFGQGNSVFQECRGILAEIQKALSTLQRNATAIARAKRSAGREKGKHL